MYHPSSSVFMTIKTPSGVRESIAKVSNQELAKRANFFFIFFLLQMG